MNKLKGLLPIVLIVLAPAVMLYHVWDRPVSAGEDDVIYYYPLRKMVGEALREGRLPLVSSPEPGGAPLMADPQSAVTYPPTWIFAAMDPKLAYSLSIFLGFSLAGVGAYLYLRRVGLLEGPALFGALAFMFCGFLVGHRVHLGMLHTACWLPWGLWCIEGLRKGALRAFLWMVPIGFLGLTAGHFPTFIQMGLLWVAYLLLRARPLLLSALTGAAGLLLIAALAAPQIALTADLLSQSTRGRTGYARAGENSFFPPAGALAMFPMIMGSRTPNFFPQKWWGPWNQCEMLGYIGLVTLVLAAAGVRVIYRRKPTAPEVDVTEDSGSRNYQDLQELVRKWTWIAIGAFVLMLGYYLPTYRLVHMLPVLSMVRCPARFMLVLDMGLATLAGITVHVLIVSDGAAETLARLRSAVRRFATIVLPILMLITLVLIGIIGALLIPFFPERIPYLFTGGAKDMLRSLYPPTPAIWVPFGLLVATALVVCFWVRSPRRRAPILIALLLGDLLFITWFVDSPPSGAPAPDPEESPAAEYLKQHAPTDRPYRVWGLGQTYHDRPPELLLPKTCESLGFSSIAGYGPFLTPTKAHLLDFRIFGTNRNWEHLIRRNHLLSLYNVRYILAAAPAYRRVIESVRIPRRPPGKNGPNLLTGEWRLKRAGFDRGSLRLSTPFLWRWSLATQPIKIQANTIYRISLDARAPVGGAANFLRAEVLQRLQDGSPRDTDSLGLTAFAEQITTNWRHFEWTFRTPDEISETTTFRVHTMSERSIEVRDLSLRASDWDYPINLGGKLRPGERVYRRLIELPAVRSGDPVVAIYENLLCRFPESSKMGRAADCESLQELKWSTEEPPNGFPQVANLGVVLPTWETKRVVFLPALGVLVYALLLVHYCVQRRKKFR